MGWLALLNHGLNFFAPALWLALLLPLACRFFMKKSAKPLALTAQVALLFVVGGVALTLGLVAFGRDGKLLTYLALVLGVASAQALVLRR